MSITPGTRLGVYEITAKIGEGGMGEVYRARDTSLDRDVALKVLPPHFTEDSDRLGRFEREAKVLASLNHPNIGHIYGLEESGGQKALVLELIEGPTLAERIAQGAIPVDEAIPIARQIGEALEAAHQQGVIHRDLKPANIKLRPDGTVKVLDFGLAKAFQPDASDASLSASPTISLTAAATQMGMVIGTAAYMAPEQAKGKPVDKRADVWAFGAVLAEMLSGQRPFGGGDVSDTLAAVLRLEADLSGLPEDTPRRLRQVIVGCLKKDPKQRIRDIGDVLLALDGTFDTIDGAPPGSAPSPPASMWGRPPAVLALVLIAAVASGLGVWTFARPESRDGLMRFEIAPDAATPLSLLGPNRNLVISRDGQLIVYTGVSASQPQLFLRSIDQFEAVPLRGTEGGVAPFFSPDGEWVGFQDLSGTLLQKVSVLGGPPVTVTRTPERIFGASWGPDNMIVFGTLGGLYRVPDGGGEAEPLTTPDADQLEVGHGFPAVLPDGNAVAFMIGGQGDGSPTGQLAIVEVESGEIHRLGLAGVSPIYTPTGHLVYAAGDGSVRAVPFDVRTLGVTGNPVPVLESVSVKPSGAANFSLAEDGRLIYAVGGNSGRILRSLVWVDRSGREEPLDVPRRAYSYARLSPDGTRIALDARDEENDIWIWDLARETLDRLTRDPGANRLPVWSPDSSRVAFTAARDGAENAYWQAADGSGQADALTAGTVFQGPQAFTPDGSQLLTVGPATPPYDIGVVAVDGDGTVEPLLDGPYSESNGEVSPDGRWLAYESDESGRSEIYVRPLPEVDARRIVISTEGGSRPLWSKNGTELFYFIAPGTIVAVPVQLGDDFVAGNPETLFEGEYPSLNTGRHYDVSPDGQRFLLLAGFLDGDGEAAQIMLVDNWHQELLERVPVP